MVAFLRKKIWLAALAIPVLFQYSCKKVSPLSIDNDQVIQTPYGLYVANSYGLLLNTNDGSHFTSVFPADGFAPIAMVTSRENLLLAKDNLHLSTNNGKSFFPVYTNLNHQPWQEQIVDVPMQNRVYVTSTQGKGVAYSADNGKTWVVDAAFNPLMPPAYQITSFAAHNDGSVYAFSNQSLLLLKKDNADAQWNPVTTEGLFPADDGVYFLTGDGQALFLIEYSGKRPHYMSEDGGIHWTRIKKDYVPDDIHIYTAARAPGGPLVIGTEGEGVFRQEGDQFVAASLGFDIGLTVKRLSVKKNVYKNGSVKYFMFAATNKGLYRSEDKGYNWDLMTDTSYTHNYQAMY